MGGTYKKKLRAEKAKVKLKGAKLPKGLNVTKTEFKVRKIQIREQLKECQYQNGQRQINLKETLSRLKHHRSNFRVEALRNLREAITMGHPGITMSLNEIIQGISSVCLNIEKETRRDAFRTLDCLLGACTAQSITPFFHVLSSYLRCGLTHIQSAIQEDTLLMLDVLLQHIPELVVQHSDKILKNFLEMISRVRAEGNRAGRTLTINMGKKQTTMKWRSKVLQRLQKILHTKIEQSRDKSDTSCRKVRLAPNFQSHVFSEKEPQHYPIIVNTRSHCDFSEIFNQLPEENENCCTSDEGELLRSNIQHLVPLLCDAWLEVRPQVSSDANQVVISEDAAITLQVVLAIMEDLWKLVEIEEDQANDRPLSKWFQQKYGETFASNFVSAFFPYQRSEIVANENPKKKSKRILSINDRQCISQNNSIAYLMCKFFECNIKQQAEKFHVVLKYVGTAMEAIKQRIIENQLNIALCLEALLVDNGLEVLQLDKESGMQVLRSTIEVYLNNQFLIKDGVSVKVLILLCRIVQAPSLMQAYGKAEFTNFLQYLPKLLLKSSIAEAAVLTLSQLGKQKNMVFLDALQAMIEPIIANLQKIQVTGAANAFEGRKHIVNLFYWVDATWTEEYVKQLTDQIRTNITDKRIVEYFQYVLQLKHRVI